MQGSPSQPRRAPHHRPATVLPRASAVSCVPSAGWAASFGLKSPASFSAPGNCLYSNDLDLPRELGSRSRSSTLCGFGNSRRDFSLPWRHILLARTTAVLGAVGILAAVNGPSPTPTGIRGKPETILLRREHGSPSRLPKSEVRLQQGYRRHCAFPTAFVHNALAGCGARASKSFPRHQLRLPSCFLRPVQFLAAAAIFRSCLRFLLV